MSYRATAARCASPQQSIPMEVKLAVTVAFALRQCELCTLQFFFLTLIKAIKVL